MRAEAVHLLRFFQTGMQCLIPIYQRTYSWTDEQCESLWSDIVKVGTHQNIPTHFVGSFVYIQDSNVHLLGATPQYMVIDGQQRITTISLLLLALSNAIEENGGELLLQDNFRITPTYIKNNYLLNSNEEGERRFKLILTQSDKDTYLSLLENVPLPENYSARIQENYEYFLDKLQEPNLDLRDIYLGIQKLMIVSIALDRTSDNPQLIFESLNSTGLELSEADKIRNYVLMGLEPARQTRIYNEFWYPMERSFGHSENTIYFDRFIRDYLTLKLYRIPNVRDVHREFKDYTHTGEYENIESLVSDIYNYSQYFVRMVLGRETDNQLLNLFNNLNQLKVDVVYPFLLRVYADFTSAIITRDELIEILQLLESYVFRRAICGIPTNSMNKTFANLYKEIVQDDYLNSFKASLLLKDSYRRFPSSEEFMRELAIKNVYNFRSSNYLLSKIENSQYANEVINLGQFSIEHILPQNENLSEEWRRDLGENWSQIQSQYLHTLGNLTLTGYNSELSDRPFMQKRDMEGGFRTSRLFLNAGLRDLMTWNENEIINRANHLSSIAVNVWQFPNIDEGILSNYRQARTTQRIVNEYSVSDYRHSHEENLIIFNALRQRILSLDASIIEQYNRFYVAFKTSNESNFTCIVFQRTRLRITMSIDLQDLNDSNEICSDVRGLGRWGGGNTQFGINNLNDVDYAFNLISQSYQSSMME